MYHIYNDFCIVASSFRNKVLMHTINFAVLSELVWFSGSGEFWPRSQCCVLKYLSTLLVS